jgi:hypothetical protein
MGLAYCVTAARTPATAAANLSSFFPGFSTCGCNRMTGGTGQTGTPLGVCGWGCYKSAGGLTPNEAYPPTASKPFKSRIYIKM